MSPISSPAGMAESHTAESHLALVPAEAAGIRLDRYLTDALAGKVEALSRARLKALMDEGQVFRQLAAGEEPVADASYKVKEGEAYRVHVPPPVAARPQGQHIPLDVRYEDDELIVVMKPAGLVVHPAPGNPDMTLVNALIAHCGDTLSGIGGERRPGIVHRLDKETSGLMVVAKTDRAHRHLAEQFAIHGRDGRLSRAYLALVWGTPNLRSGMIEGAIGRSPNNRLKMAIVKSGGREAITHYRVLQTFGKPEPLVTLVECVLETGRTHQIRVHLTATGHPLLGDALYGNSQKTRRNRLPPAAQAALDGLNRQALHAYRLGFEHPVTGEAMEFEDELPADLALLIRNLELL
ncbi:MAG: RluA family pseudouridine synthase [Parvibaculaceae bacterium]|nr:RluA family pseudouridine synthase [Parvibaculaceae bacterium]